MDYSGGIDGGVGGGGGAGADPSGRSQAGSSASVPLLSADFAPSVNGTGEADGSSEDPHGGLPAFLKPGTTIAYVWTLTSISLGIGVFVLPFVFASVGTLLASSVLIALGFWSNYCCIVLIRLSRAFDCYSYEVLARSIGGRFGEACLSWFIAVSLLLGNAGHIKTVVGLTHDLLEYYITGDYGQIQLTKTKELILYVALLGLALVFCSRDTISGLSGVSTASVMVVLAACMWLTGECLFWYWPHGHHAFSGHNAAPLAVWNWHDFFANTPAIAFVYSGTFALFHVYHDLPQEKRSVGHISRLISISTIVCCMGYLIVALAGILTFGKHINMDTFRRRAAGNYLYTFPPDHWVVTFFCAAVAIVITLLYAVINHVMLASLTSFIKLLPVPSVVDFRPHLLGSRFYRLIMSALGMVLVVLINLAFTNLVSLFGLCGSWGVGFVCFIIPSALYITFHVRFRDSKPGYTTWPGCALHFTLICLMMAIVIGYTTTL